MSYIASDMPASALLQVGRMADFAVADGDGNAVVWKRANGSAMYMTYRSERGAQVALARVRKSIPDARIVEKD